MRPFEIANRASFLRNIQDDKRSNELQHDSNELEPSYDVDGLFNSSDRVKILFSTIEALPVLPPGEETSNLVRKLNETIKEPTDRIQEEYRNKYLCDTLRQWEFVDTIAPIHQTTINDKICKELLNPRRPFPLEALRAYYGEEV